MRYWLTSVVIVLLCVTGVAPLAQDKKKDFGKDKKEFKDKKDKDKKDVPEFKEPSEVLGKNFEYWKDKIKSEDPTEREVAMKNVLFFGSERAFEAMPEIIKQLNRQKTTNIDLSVRVNGIQALSTIFRYKQKDVDVNKFDQSVALYRMFLKDPQVILKLQTVKGVPYLGPCASECFPEVHKLVDDPNSWEVRKEAIPVMAFLAKQDSKYVPDALKSLRNRYRDAPGGVEKSYLVRGTAVEAIGLLSSGEMPKELSNALEDKTAHVRLIAIQSIASMSVRKQMRPESESSALKRLDEYLYEKKEKDDILIMWTHAAIMTIKKKATKAEIDPIRERIHHSETHIKMTALQILAMGGPDAKPFVLKDVQGAVHDHDVTIGVQAIKTLVAMNAKECKPMLQKILKDEKANDFLYNAALDACYVFDAIEKADNDKANKDKKAEK